MVRRRSRALALLLTLLAGCGCSPAVVVDAGSTPEDAGSAAREPLVCAPLPVGVASGHVGSGDDVVTDSRRSVVLMGGGPEVDVAMRAFVESAAGGDVLVLRASGSTESYLPYLESELSPSPPPSSVRVLRIDDDEASSDDAVTCRVEASEAVWLAGGDQSAYLLGWHEELHARLRTTTSWSASIGGTSAGAMSLGELAFDAALGSVTSEEALLAPTDALVSVSMSPFAQPELRGFVVDTHYSERDREGRLLAFLAHARHRQGLEEALGVGLDEEVALVVLEGEATVHAPFGGSAWLYRFVGEARLQVGTTLEMDLVERVRLDDGARVAWPPVWQTLRSGPTASDLAVVDGVVELQ